MAHVNLNGPSGHLDFVDILAGRPGSCIALMGISGWSSSCCSHWLSLSPGHQGDFLVFWLIWFWPGRVFPWFVGRYYGASLLRIALTNSIHGVCVCGKHAKSTPVAKGNRAFFMRITVWT